jgi:hypothetical protein
MTLHKTREKDSLDIGYGNERLALGKLARVSNR